MPPNPGESATEGLKPFRYDDPSTYFLARGAKANQFKDVYIAFISDSDPFDMGLPCYHVSHIIEGTDVEVDFGFHFQYVNAAEAVAGTPMGDLCADLFGQEIAAMTSAETEKALRYAQEGPGKESISQRMKETIWEIQEANAETMVRSKYHYSDEQISEALTMPIEEVREIRARVEAEMRAESGDNGK